MRHFVALEPCPSEGAYRYLVERERPKSVEIVLIHQLGRKRITRVVATVPKVALDIHGPGYSALGRLGSLPKDLEQTGRELLALGAKLKNGRK